MKGAKKLQIGLHVYVALFILRYHVIDCPLGYIIPLRAAYYSIAQTKLRIDLLNPIGTIWLKGIVYKAAGWCEGHATHWRLLIDCPFHRNFDWDQTCWVANRPLQHSYRWACSNVFRMSSVIDLESRSSRLFQTDYRRSVNADAEHRAFAIVFLCYGELVN